MDEARPLEGKRILVVEDNYLVAEALCDVMRDAGAVPLGPVCSAEAAITAAGQGPLDGVLLDVGLQGRNGTRVSEYLESKNVPFLLVTGYDKAALHPRLREAPYLAKPPVLADLLESATALFGDR